MSRAVHTALKMGRFVAQRSDPLEPISVGQLAIEFELSVSAASRACSALQRLGWLERASDYGSYCAGPRALALSGRAAAVHATTVNLLLLRAAQHTGETVCLVARGSRRIIAAVESGWTLHAPASVGDEIALDGALSRAVTGYARDGATEESSHGLVVEIAAPIRDPSGERVAAIAVRLPRNRARAGRPRALRALAEAQRTLERSLEAVSDASERDPRTCEPAENSEKAKASASAEPLGSLALADHLLWQLAARPASVTQVARAVGLRTDRVARLLAACEAAGLLERIRSHDDACAVSWAVHGWHRAAVPAALVSRGRALVAATARATGECVFLTVLKGMRSVTVVEELRSPGDGLRLLPWLGRPCPILGADGGPTLLADLDVDVVAGLIRARAGADETNEFVARLQRVAAQGVLAKESLEEYGQIAVSAPVRDWSGAIVAAVCIVGASDQLRPRVGQLKAATIDLAAGVSGQLGAPPPAKV